MADDDDDDDDDDDKWSGEVIFNDRINGATFYVEKTLN